MSADRLLLDLATDPKTWPSLSGDIAFICAGQPLLAQCERDPIGTRAINVTATAELVRRLAANGAHVVLPSTSAVFSGARAYPRPDDAPAPMNEYGRQKAEIERLMCTEFPDQSSVLRIGKVVDARVQLFAQWLQLLRSGKPIRAFSDMVMAPLVPDLTVEALSRVGERRVQGIVHLAASRDITYFDAGRQLAHEMNASLDLVIPGSCAEVGIVAPLHTVLDCAATPRLIGMSAPEPEEAIRALNR